MNNTDKQRLGELIAKASSSDNLTASELAELRRLLDKAQANGDI